MLSHTTTASSWPSLTRTNLIMVVQNRDEAGGTPEGFVGRKRRARVAIKRGGVLPERESTSAP